MKTKQYIFTLLIATTSLTGFAQHKKATTHQPTEEPNFYYQKGVKMNEKHNTPLLFTNLNELTVGNSPTEMAFNWISANKTLLGINSINDITVSFKRSGLSGHTIRFQQTLNEVPIFNAQIAVHISPKNKVTYVDNLFDPTLEQIKTIPALTKSEAFQAALRAINAKGKISYSSNELMVYNQNKATQLIYKVVIESELPIGSWEILVNAQNGTVLHAKDVSFYSNENKPAKKIAVNGTGNVFLSDPLSAAAVSYGGNYADNSDATNAQLDAARATVTLLDIDETDGIFTLKGPYAEITDVESPLNGLFTQDSSTFNFNRNEDGFEAVNAYYHIDHSMRYINETLGITLTPYQYTGGVKYDPHGLGGSDNSYYSGGSGSLAFGEGCVDDAEDADVIIHELGHGIHDWITGGNSSAAEGLGEGSGDYWSQSYNRSLNQWTAADNEYQWMFNWDGHNACWGGRVTNYTGAYPSLSGSIHTDGQIWASTLMRIYDQIGRSKTDKAFLEGLGMTGSTSGQQDAAIAVRQAAIDMNYSCSDVAVFTNEFTTTGYMLPDYTCTVGINELTDNKVSVYPNPTKDILSIVLEENTKNATITLIDNLGRTVYSNSFNSNTNSINLARFAKGIYTLIIRTNDRVISKKIVKE
jgi:Zn-dependent metalloprotease